MKRLSLLLFLLPALLDAPVQAAPEREETPPAERRSRHMLRWMHRSNGVYSVLEAAATGNEEVLKARLKEGADPNLQDEMGIRPIHLAARSKSARVLEMLLQAGADPQATDAEGRTAFELCRNKKQRSLLSAANAERKKEIKLDEMVKAGDERGVRRALKAGVSPNARSADSKGTLVITAVEADKPDVLRILLDAGAKADTISYATGCAALHIAAQRGNVEMIRMLLKAGADPMCQSSNGAYPIHDVVWHGHLAALKALLPAYAKVNFSPHGGHNGFPINLAIQRSHDDQVKAFIEAGFKPNDPRLKDDPPLIMAARHGRAACVKMLLRAGANKKARDSSGKSAADYASPDIASLLH